MKIKNYFYTDVMTRENLLWGKKNPYLFVSDLGLADWPGGVRISLNQMYDRYQPYLFTTENSAGTLGKRCGSKPDGDCVYAPISGTVSMAADTGQDVGITGKDSLRLLIHIGPDMVAMDGNGFKVNVKPVG